MRKRRSRGQSAALATADELWGARAPKQARSAEAIQVLAGAADALFRARPYEEVTVAEIAAAAGQSVGAVYTRFPSKEYLLLFMLRELSDELALRAEREFARDAVDRLSTDAIVHRYLLMMFDAFTRHRGLLRPASLIARQSPDPRFRELVGRFNERVHACFRDALLRRLAPTASQRPVVAEQINVALLWSSAAMREVFLYGEPVSRLSRKDGAMISELTRAVTCYVAPQSRTPGMFEQSI